VSDSFSEISASESESEEEQDGDSREILGKDGYVRSQKPKAVRRTPMRNIVIEKPGPKGSGFQADTHLKSFELFFCDTIITEIVTWTKQNIENVKTSSTSKLDICTLQALQKFAHSYASCCSWALQRASKKVLQAFG
jgi:hypothetical protein